MELCSISSSTPLVQISSSNIKIPASKSCLFFPVSNIVTPKPMLSTSQNKKKLYYCQHSFSSFPNKKTVITCAVAPPHSAIEPLPADILVTESPEPNSRVRLSVEVPRAVCEDSYQRVLNEFMKHAKVPGFRPGKNVPENIIVNYVGKQNVRKAVIESILKRTLPHAMSSVDGRALKDSVHIATKFSEMEKTYSSLKKLIYDVVADVAPEVKWVSEDAYKHLKIVVEIDSEIDAQRTSEEELRRRHKSLSVLRIVTDRGLQIGDVAVLDISASTVEQDGSSAQRIPSAETTGFNFDTEDGDKVLPGFLDSIIGIQRGETKSFPLVFPESWRQENLRGVHAQFTVECKELFYRDFPELGDSIADKLLPGCSTLEEVKKALLERCLEVEKTAKEQATDNAILDQLTKGSVKLNENQLASLTSPKAVNEYLESQKENIVKVIKQNMAVGDIFKRENLQFPTEELVKEVENSIAEFKRQNQEYDEERVKDQVEDILEGAKVLEWLREHAEVEYITR